MRSIQTKLLAGLLLLALTACGGGGGGGGGDTPTPTTVAQGNAASPADVSGLLPYAGQVDTTASYYRYTAVGGETAFTLTGLSNNADLYVYGAADFSTGLQCLSATAGTANETCTLTGAAGVAQVFYVKVAWTSGGSGATFMLNVTIPALVAEGSAVSPADVSGLLPYAGQVDTTASYYRYTAVGGETAFTLVGLSNNADLFVYNNANFTGLNCSSATAGTANETCTLTGAAGVAQVFYIKVAWTNGGSGATFLLDATTPAPVAQGSVGTPIDISGLEPYAGQVNTTVSYYRYTAVSGETAFTLTGLSNNADLYVYNNADFTTGLNCSSATAGTANETCTLTGAATVGQVFYIKVAWTSGGSGAVFTVNVTNPAPPVAEGSVAAPVNFTVFHMGQVDATASYYRYVAGGGETAFTLSNLARNLDIYVYSAADFTTGLICSSLNTGTSNENCVLSGQAATDQVFYIKVAWNAAGSGAKFFLLATFAPLVAEGSVSTPVILTGLLPYAGQVDSTSSFYRAVAVGGETGFTLTRLTNAADIYVNVTGGGSCSVTGGGTADKVCVLGVPATTGQTIDIEVRWTAGTAGAKFYLYQIPLTAQGSAGSPVNVTGKLPYPGQVAASTTSYYVYTAVGGETSFFLDTWMNSPALSIYSASDFTGLICSSICTLSSPATAGQVFYIKVDYVSGLGGSGYILKKTL